MTTTPMTETRGPYVQVPVTVRRVRRISPSFVRVTFSGEGVRRVGHPGADQRIKLAFPRRGTSDVALPPGPDWYRAYRAMPEADRPPIRTYTIRALRRDLGELDVDMVLHGEGGPASAWAAAAAAGDRVVLVAPCADWQGPTGGYEWDLPATVRRVLLVGDETAVPALSVILERLPADVVADVVVEVPHVADLALLPRRPSTRVRATARSECTRPAAPGASLLDGVRSTPLPVDVLHGGRAGADVGHDEVGSDAEVGDDAGVGDAVLWEAARPGEDAPLSAWVAGEAAAVRAVRRHLVGERGVDRSHVSFMGYWRLGRAET